jgi:hypothetical protein
MTVKLNLTINENTAKKAKDFAEKNNISISKLVDEYLRNLTSNSSKKINVSFAKKFAGTLSTPIKNLNEAKAEYLKKKYGK